MSQQSDNRWEQFTTIELDELHWALRVRTDWTSAGFLVTARQLHKEIEAELKRRGWA